MEQINIDVFSAINQFAGRNPLIDDVAILAAEYLPVVFLLPLLYLWFGQKENGKDYALLAGYSSILGIILNFAITLIYFHPRPFMDGIGHVLINHADETSFPSDHTTLMLSFALLLLFFKSTRTMGCVLTAIGLIGGLARVFCGIHFPFDIAGSFLAAFVAAIIVWSLREKLAVLNKQIINLYIKLFAQKVQRNHL